MKVGAFTALSGFIPAKFLTSTPLPWQHTTFPAEDVAEAMGHIASITGISDTLYMSQPISQVSFDILVDDLTFMIGDVLKVSDGTISEKFRVTNIEIEPLHKREA